MVSIGDQNDGFCKFGWETLSVLQPADHIANIKRDKLPFEDKSVIALNASHVLEHLRDNELEHMLKEAYRVLIPGGMFRIVVPDLTLFIDSYHREGLSLHLDRILVPHLSMRDVLERDVLKGLQHPDVLLPHNGLISIVASYTNGHPLPIANQALVDDLLQKEAVDEFVHWCVSLKDDSVEDFGHFNGFTYERLKKFLLQAGFEEVARSFFGEMERDHVFRGIDRADKNSISLYINAKKARG